jgi:hypothetical protein
MSMASVSDRPPALCTDRERAMRLRARSLLHVLALGN